MKRRSKSQREWARNNIAYPSSRAKLNHDPLEARRRELWNRALAENIPPEIAARMIAAILRVEDSATKAFALEGLADA